MIPWLLAVLLLIAHLPACFLRAVEWESAQYLVGVSNISTSFVAVKSRTVFDPRYIQYCAHSAGIR